MKKGLLMTLSGLTGIVLVLEFMERHHASGHEAHLFLGFYWVFGLLAALLLAAFAKLFLFKLIGRPRDYYEPKKSDKHATATRDLKPKR